MKRPRTAASCGRHRHNLPLFNVGSSASSTLPSRSCGRLPDTCDVDRSLPDHGKRQVGAELWPRNEGTSCTLAARWTTAIDTDTPSMDRDYTTHRRSGFRRHWQGSSDRLGGESSPPSLPGEVEYFACQYSCRRVDPATGKTSDARHCIWL